MKKIVKYTATNCGVSQNESQIRFEIIKVNDINKPLRSFFNHKIRLNTIHLALIDNP